MNIFAGQIARNGNDAAIARGAGFPSNPSAPSLPSRPPAQSPFLTALLNDPVYRQLQGTVNTNNAQAQANAGTGYGQTLAQYGAIPDFAQTAQQLGLNPSSPLYQTLMNASQNPNTQNAANALTAQGLSTVGGINQAQQAGIASTIGDQAAKGTLDSGATAAGLRLNDLNTQAQRYTAAQNVLNALSGITSQYQTAQQAGLAQLQTGLGQAATRQIAANPTPATQFYAGLLKAAGLGGGVSGSAGSSAG